MSAKSASQTGWCRKNPEDPWTRAAANLFRWVRSSPAKNALKVRRFSSSAVLLLTSIGFSARCGHGWRLAAPPCSHLVLARRGSGRMKQKPAFLSLFSTKPPAINTVVAGPFLSLWCPRCLFRGGVWRCLGRRPLGWARSGKVGGLHGPLGLIGYGFVQGRRPNPATGLGQRRPAGPAAVCSSGAPCFTAVPALIAVALCRGPTHLAW